MWKSRERERRFLIMMIEMKTLKLMFFLGSLDSSMKDVVVNAEDIFLFFKSPVNFWLSKTPDTEN